MLRERNIQPEWADLAIQNPDETEDRADGTRHFIKQISEFDNKWLRVIVNMKAHPNKKVTAFLIGA